MGRSGSRREEKAERGSKEGRLKVKVEAEGRERKKDIKRGAVWKWGFDEGRGPETGMGANRAGFLSAP